MAGIIRNFQPALKNVFLKMKKRGAFVYFHCSIYNSWFYANFNIQKNFFHIIRIQAIYFTQNNGNNSDNINHNDDERLPDNDMVSSGSY